MLSLLLAASVSPALANTVTDVSKLLRSKQYAEALVKTDAVLAKHPAAFPEILATSADSGGGIPELRAAIARLVAERRA